MLSPGIEAAAAMARHALDELLAEANRASASVIETNSIPAAVLYFAELRNCIEDVNRRAGALAAHVETLNRETIPTLFENQHVKTINVTDLGRVSVNIKWSATMLDKAAAFGWCRQTRNDGLIIETINAQTLGAFAKTEAIAGRPLPSDVFKVSTSKHLSITKD